MDTWRVSQENVELVKRLAEAFLGNDFETSLSLMDPEIHVYPRPEEPGVDDVYRGHDGMFEWATNWYSQWDEYDAEPVSYRDAPGDQVLVVFRERGRMDRAGIEVEEEFSHSFTVRDGRVVEWRQYDSYEQAIESLGLA
jgi:ketosteroid isomerase-like protein